MWGILGVTVVVPLLAVCTENCESIWRKAHHCPAASLTQGRCALKSESGLRIHARERERGVLYISVVAGAAVVQFSRVEERERKGGGGGGEIKKVAVKTQRLWKSSSSTVICFSLFFLKFICFSLFSCTFVIE